MDFFNQFTDVVANLGETAAQKTKDFTDVTKHSYDIHKLENEMNQKFQEIGKLVFEAEEAGEETPDLSEQIAKLQELKAEMKDIQDQVKIIKGVEICPFCGGEVDPKAAFCSHCGADLSKGKKSDVVDDDITED